MDGTRSQCGTGQLLTATALSVYHYLPARKPPYRPHDGTENDEGDGAIVEPLTGVADNEPRVENLFP